MAKRYGLEIAELETVVEELTDHESEQVVGGLVTTAPTGNATSLPPVDRNGDVKNLDGAPGGSDSIWIDLGASVTQRVEWPPR